MAKPNRAVAQRAMIESCQPRHEVQTTSKESRPMRINENQRRMPTWFPCGAPVSAFGGTNSPEHIIYKTVTFSTIRSPLPDGAGQREPKLAKMRHLSPLKRIG